MAKIKRPPKGKWKVGDVATFGGVIGRVIAIDPQLGGYPMMWVTTEPGMDYGKNKRGMVVKFDLDGKFQSWHRDPLLTFVRRPTKKEMKDLVATITVQVEEKKDEPANA